MPPRKVPIHYLRPNEKESTPQHVIVFDTEARQHPDGDDIVLTPRCWFGSYFNRSKGTDTRRLAEHLPGKDGEDLEAWVNEIGMLNTETWAFAHNVHFDLTLTNLPVRLMARGWHLSDFQLFDTAAFFVLTRTGHKLILTDSWTWLPTSLAKIGAVMGARKLRLPDDADSDAAWMARCRRDVEITATAVLDLLDWWDDKRLGKFAITGAACGWNAARHHHLQEKVLIDPDPDARAFERTAIFGGRREAWWVGESSAGRWTDWDFANAYPTAAAVERLPVKRLAPFDHLEFSDPLWRSPMHDVIAECVVVTSVPSIPCRIGGEVFYPVGVFTTTLAGPEIRLALELGAAVTIGKGYGYRTSYPLQSWAEWVIRVLRGEEPNTPKVAEIVAKSWSRSVIGKFASHTSQVVATQPSIWPGWHLEEGWDHDEGKRVDIVSLGGIERTIVRDQEADNSFPAMLAFVESYVRADLTRTVLSRPPGSVWQINTDGWLEQTIATRGAAKVPTSAGPYTVHAKGSYNYVRVIGPNHLRLGDQRVYSGVPADATEVADDSFTVNLWPKLRWQMEHGSLDSYRRPGRKLKVTGPYTHRWVMPDGSTEPVHCSINGQGETVIDVPYGISFGMSQGIDPERQHPTLAKLLR